MKKISKAFSLAISAIMALCLCSFGAAFDVGAASPGLAAAANTIIISPETGYTLDNTTYTIYKVFAATVNEAGSAYTYTTDANCLQTTDNQYTISGNVYTPNDIDSETDARTFANALYNYYIAEGHSGTVGGNVFKLSSADEANNDKVTIESSTGKITFDVSNQAGYYLMVGSVTTGDGQNSTVTSLAMLNTATNKAGIEVHPKVELPHITDEGKKARDASDTSAAFKQISDSEIGKQLEYRIAVTIPNTAGYNDYHYKIVDTLATGLTYDNGSAHVYVDDNSEKELPASGVTVSYSSQVLTVNINLLSSDVKNKIAEVSGASTLVLHYTATVSYVENKYVMQTDDDNNYLENTVKLVYPSNPYTTVETDHADTPPSKSYNYTYGIEVDKFTPGEGSTKTYLAGAEFKIKNSSGTILKFKKQGTDATSPKYVLSSDDDAVETITVGTDGKLNVIGFDADTKYILNETKAPDGYQLYTQDIPFVIHPEYAMTNNNILNNSVTLPNGNSITSLAFRATSGDRTTDTDNVTYNNANSAAGSESNLIIELKNTGGQELVGTGGIGTTIFYVAGGILMAGAAVLLVTKIRMKNK